MKNKQSKQNKQGDRDIDASDIEKRSYTKPTIEQNVTMERYALGCSGSDDSCIGGTITSV